MGVSVSNIRNCVAKPSKVGIGVGVDNRAFEHKTASETIVEDKTDSPTTAMTNDVRRVPNSESRTSAMTNDVRIVPNRATKLKRTCSKYTAFEGKIANVGEVYDMDDQCEMESARSEMHTGKMATPCYQKRLQQRNYTRNGRHSLENTGDSIKKRFNQNEYQHIKSSVDCYSDMEYISSNGINREQSDTLCGSRGFYGYSSNRQVMADCFDNRTEIIDDICQQGCGSRKRESSNGIVSAPPSKIKDNHVHPALSTARSWSIQSNTDNKFHDIKVSVLGFVKGESKREVDVSVESREAVQPTPDSGVVLGYPYWLDNHYKNFVDKNGDMLEFDRRKTNGAYIRKGGGMDRSYISKSVVMPFRNMCSFSTDLNGLSSESNINNLADTTKIVPYSNETDVDSFSNDSGVIEFENTEIFEAWKKTGEDLLRYHVDHRVSQHSDICDLSLPGNTLHEPHTNRI